jgi:hypothetical protein
MAFAELIQTFMTLSGIAAIAQVAVSIIALTSKNKPAIKAALILSLIVAGFSLWWFLLIVWERTL